MMLYWLLVYMNNEYCYNINVVKIE